jgi:hypothetical protein
MPGQTETHWHDGLIHSTGDQTGPTSALNICTPDQSLPKHFLIPARITQLSDDDREFLQRKGVYTLPRNDTCNSLIAAYLLHVHPIMPVIEADDLLIHNQEGKLQYYNLLLLWSIFFAAANVLFPTSVSIPETLIQHDSLSRATSSKQQVMHQGGR